MKKSLISLLILQILFLSAKSQTSPNLEFNLQNDYQNKIIPSLPTKMMVSPSNQIILQPRQVLNRQQPIILTPYMFEQDEFNNGEHNREQIAKVFTNHSMTKKQVDTIFFTIDKDNSNDLIKVALFQIKNGKNFIIFLSSLFKCLTRIKTQEQISLSFHLYQIKTQNQTILKTYMISNNLSISWINENTLHFMNICFQEESPSLWYNVAIMATSIHIYCAISIAVPKVRHFSSSDERQIYLSAIILTDGYYSGQTSRLNVTQFTAITSVYNYFGDYELPYNDGIIRKQDFIRAVQEGQLPYYYNPMVVDQLFIGMKDLDIIGLSQTIYGYREYIRPRLTIDLTVNDGKSITMNLVSFTESITKMPQKIQYLINKSATPDQADLNAASKKLYKWPREGEESFLASYNNLIFLQKSSITKGTFSKMSAASKNRNRTVPLPSQVLRKIQSIKYYNTGVQCFFNILNAQTNQFIDLKNFLHFYRISSMYLEIDPMNNQRIDYNQLKVAKHQPLTLNSFNDANKLLYNQLIDFLQINNQFFINYKEFIEWFFLENVFELLKSSSNKYMTGLERLVIGFQLLSLRLTENAIQQSVVRYDRQMQDYMVNFKKTFIIALSEEIMCNVLQFKNGLANVTVLDSRLMNNTNIGGQISGMGLPYNNGIPSKNVQPIQV